MVAFSTRCKRYLFFLINFLVSFKKLIGRLKIVPMITRPNGKVLSREPACRALRPPASKRVAASAPSRRLQKTLCHTGGWGFPFAASISTTNDPESEDVTKKPTSKMSVRVDVTSLNGRASRKKKKLPRNYYL